MSSPPYKIESLDVLGRAIEKHLSREIDQFHIEHGVASERGIAKKNDLFAALDLRRFKISSIGNRKTHTPLSNYSIISRSTS
jgi:hypothetical protein